MIIAGLLSSQSEAREIQYIAKVCVVTNRIHYIVRRETLRTLLRMEKDNERHRFKQNDAKEIKD